MVAAPARGPQRLGGSEREAGSVGGRLGLRARGHGAPLAGGGGRASAVNRCQEREEPQRAGQVLGQAGKRRSERESARPPPPPPGACPMALRGDAGDRKAASCHSGPLPRAGPWRRRPRAFEEPGRSLLFFSGGEPCLPLSTDLPPCSALTACGRRGLRREMWVVFL